MDFTITRMEDQDFVTFHKWYKDPAYAPFFRHTPKGLTIDELKIVFTIMGIVIRVDTPDSRMAAVVTVAANSDTQIADVGVMVDKDLRRQRIGEHITRKTLHYLFTEGTVDRVIMYATEPTTIAALKRGGFFEECRMHKNAFYNGKLHNESRLVMTKSFYQKTNNIKE